MVYKWNGRFIWIKKPFVALFLFHNNIFFSLFIFLSHFLLYFFHCYSIRTWLRWLRVTSSPPVVFSSSLSLSLSLSLSRCKMHGTRENDSKQIVCIWTEHEDCMNFKGKLWGKQEERSTAENWLPKERSGRLKVKEKKGNWWWRRRRKSF